MKVAISVLGRFWGFELARELQKSNFLGQLLTSYPAFVPSQQFGISREVIGTAPWLEVFARAHARLPSSIRRQWSAQSQICYLYERWAAMQLREECDVFVGWSGSSRAALLRASELGMKTFLERGSTHISFQTDILTEEYARWGLKFNETHPAIIERELEEYELADFICVPTSFTAETFLQRGISPEKLLVNPFGTNLECFNPRPREDKRFRVIYCGAMTLRKGFPYLVDAFAELGLPDAELLILGKLNDVLKDWFQKRANQHPNIKWLGTKPFTELARHYSQGDVFCLPSLEEGLPLVILQAMACGLPVLATPNTGVLDLISEGKEGFVVPIRSKDAIKEKLLWCYENRKACQAMGQAALKKAKLEMSWEQYGRRSLENYSGTLNPRSSILRTGSK